MPIPRYVCETSRLGARGVTIHRSGGSQYTDTDRGVWLSKTGVETDDGGAQESKTCTVHGCGIPYKRCRKQLRPLIIPQPS